MANLREEIRGARSGRGLSIRLRLLLMGFGMGLLLLLEVLCRWMGWGQELIGEDPFVSFEENISLFEPSLETGSYQVRASRMKWFSPEAFPQEKAPNATRLFVLGGSTVKGRPWSRETAFPFWMRLALETLEPGRRWEVVNVGGLSYASYRLAPLFQECLGYQPDLMVLCTGHNEFLEDREYRSQLPAIDAPKGKMQHWLFGSHLVQLYAQALHALKDGAAPSDIRNRWVMGGEVEALLDYRGGLEAYVRDEAWSQQVTRHFEFNLERMGEMAVRRGVPLIGVLPPSNLLDSPPFKSEMNPALSLEAKLQMEACFASLDGLADGPERLDITSRLVELDPGFAMGLYQHGRQLFRAGRVGEARDYLVRARDQDVCPLRMPSRLEEVMRRVFLARKVPLLDAHQLMAERSKSGIPGDAELADHIHPDLEGHRQMAWALLRMLAPVLELGSLPEQPPASVLETWERHMESLPPVYFQEAELALEGLRNWSRGRIEGWGLEAHEYRVRERNPASR